MGTCCGKGGGQGLRADGTTAPLSRAHVEQRLQRAERTGTLSLVNAKLELIPDEVFTFERLRILDVSENRLSALPRELASLRELKTLKCGRNRVAEAEAGALQLPALQLLELPRNCLARVPPLPASLTTLDLSHNSLVTLPASSVAHLPALRTLVLAGNQLTALPSLVDLPKLDTLDVDDNALEALGDDWSGTPGLRVLFARRNRLTAAGLRPSLFQDTLLDRMELEGNPMTRAQLMAAPASDLFLDRRRKRVDRALKADLDPDRTLAGLER